MALNHVKGEELNINKFYSEKEIKARIEAVTKGLSLNDLLGEVKVKDGQIVSIVPNPFFKMR